MALTIPADRLQNINTFLAFMLPQNGTGDKTEWLYNILLFSLLSFLLLKIKLLFHNKSGNIQNISEDVWIFPNKQLRRNAILQNTKQEAIIEFSDSTPEQGTKQTNKMPKANENLFGGKKAPMGHEVEYWEHPNLCLSQWLCLIYLPWLGKPLVNSQIFRQLVETF